MKTKMSLVGRMGLLSLLGLLFVTGCGPDAKTEARLKRIEERQQNLRDDLIAMSDLLGRTGRALETNLALMETHSKDLSLLRSNALLSVEMVLDLRDEIDAVRATNTALLSRTATATAARPVYPQAQPAAQFRDGVPIAVHNQIAAAAAREWPGDFKMQAYEIKTQVEAWRKVNGR